MEQAQTDNDERSLFDDPPDEVRRMFADADVEHPRDGKILPEFSIESDIDIESLNQYRRLVAAIKPSHAWLVLDDKSFLTKLGGYRVDRREKIEGLTLAGLLMFGKTDSITDTYCCPSYFPDYREYLDPDPNSRWTDRVCPDGTWEANLFQFYIRVFQKLSLALPKPFTLKDGIRMDETPTHVALREAFINTLIHADYLVDTNITIELWRDKYVFSNPGSLLISFSQYWKGGDSVCRNKSLLQMFMFLGTAEKAGSGVDKIIKGWKEANLRRPQLEEKKKPEKVVLELPLASNPASNSENPASNPTSNPASNPENSTSKSDNLASNPENLASNPENLASNPENPASNPENLASNPTSNLASNPTSNPENSTSKFANPASKSDNLASNTSNLASKSANSTSNPANSTSSPTSNLASNRKNPASNPTSNRNTKLSHLAVNKLQKQILEVCVEYLSVADIATKVNRNMIYLKDDIIPLMIQKGLLEREFPNTPRHRKQRYRKTI